MEHHWHNLSQQAKAYKRRYHPLIYMVFLIALAQTIHFGLLTISSAKGWSISEKEIITSDSIATEPTITEEPQELISDNQDSSITQELEESQQETSITSAFEESQQEPIPAINAKNDIGLPKVMYIHIKENSANARCPWVPDVLEYKLSEDDIPVDMSICIDPSRTYVLNDSYRQVINLLVEREAGTQSFLGKLLVAEGIISRIRSGVYGADIPAILCSGYLAQKDDDGSLHVYLGSYELTEASKDSIHAVDIALKGSNASGILLQAITELRNEQYNLELDETYYKWGSIYHFNPDLVTDSQIRVRRLARVPVSFQFEDHIFYGFWHPESSKLHL